jgi:hypothetical protein
MVLARLHPARAEAQFRDCKVRKGSAQVKNLYAKALLTDGHRRIEI